MLALKRHRNIRTKTYHEGCFFFCLKVVTYRGTPALE